MFRWDAPAATRVQTPAVLEADQNLSASLALTKCTSPRLHAAAHSRCEQWLVVCYVPSARSHVA